MKTKAIILASVLLVGCQVPKQNAGSRNQPSTGLSSASQNETDRTAEASAHHHDLWRYVGDELKMNIPENSRIRQQKHTYLRKKNHLQEVTARAEPYMYWIVEQIKQRNMPMELVLLPIVESAFNPHATSPAKAAGIWQIVPQTARNYGLKKNQWYDGRRDVVASTTAALDILQRLNGMFDGDWLLTIAAYNSGEGRVMQAVNANKAKGLSTDYWSLSLPRETALFVPKMLALSDIIKNNQRYGVQLPKTRSERALAPVDVGQQIKLSQVANVTGMPLSKLQSFNSGYTRSVTAPNGPHYIMLPRSHAAQLKNSLQDTKLAAAGSSPTNQRYSTSDETHAYRVRTGDTISSIAKRLNIPLEELKSWNTLAANKPLKAGQTLQIARTGGKTPKRNEQQVTYRVRKGDSLISIAKRHGVAIDDVMRWNAMQGKNNHIQPGDSLTLYIKPRNSSGD